MQTIQDFCQCLEQLAPQRLAEDWDNVGLLIGDRTRTVSQVMTCLTITPESVNEAISKHVDLIVAHHPLPFRPLKRVTADTVAGAMLLQLIEKRIAVYSPHTSFDSTKDGINHQIAKGLGVADPIPLEPFENDPDQLGAGRYGSLPSAIPLSQFVENAKAFFAIDGLHYVGTPQQSVSRVAVGCGSAGQFLPSALRVGCDCLVVGETNFHTCLEAKANNAALVLPGHYASERFALEMLADALQDAFPETVIWASLEESDPLIWG